MKTNNSPAYLAIGKYRDKPASFVRTYNDLDTMERDKKECAHYYWVSWVNRNWLKERLEAGHISEEIGWTYDEFNAARKQLRALLSLHDFNPNK